MLNFSLNKLCIFQILILLCILNQSSNIKIESSPDELLCNTTICPANNGVCSYNNMCNCYQGYKTIYSSETKIFCNYKQRKQIFFLVIESFLTFGIGHVYARRYLFAAVKCVFDIIIISCYFGCKAKRNTEKSRRTEKNFKRFLMLMFSFWQLIDCFLIGINYYKDGNGIELTPWF